MLWNTTYTEGCHLAIALWDSDPDMLERILRDPLGADASKVGGIDFDAWCGLNDTAMALEHHVACFDTPVSRLGELISWACAWNHHKSAVDLDVALERVQ